MVIASVGTWQRTYEKEGGADVGMAETYNKE